MSFSKISVLAGVVALASQAVAHGTVTGIIADGVYFEGYSPSFQFQRTPPVVVGWSIPKDLHIGFIGPSNYSTSDIICHLDATPAGKSAPVKAGGTVELQWTKWPTSHHGPVIDYLANCHGDCSTVDKTTLEFFKIDGVGLLNDATLPGDWASDTLIANNMSWTVTIPSDIAPGNYVLRHEIIALHQSQDVAGAQNYPQCLNLQVTGSGTATPSGTLGTALYKAADPGIAVDIYQKLATYVVPGPALYTGAASASQGAPAPSATMASASPVAATTTAAVVGTEVPTTSTPTKSACKAKTTSATAVQSQTSSDATLPTSTDGSLPTATSTPSSTGNEAVSTIPAGTTLNDLLAWISSFYTTHSGSTYDANTVARRHARDVAARAFERYDSIAPHPSGTHEHHHPHPHSTGGFSGFPSAYPTGTATGAFPYPTATSEVVAAPTAVVKGVDTGDDC